MNVCLDSFVIKALSIDSSERFQSASEMAEALSHIRSNGKRAVSRVSSALPPVGELRVEDAQADTVSATSLTIEEIANTDTVLITPLLEINLAAWEAARKSTATSDSTEEHAPQVVE